MSKLIGLKFKKKQKGGRLRHVETYQAYCESKMNANPNGWLEPKETLKTPESTDIFCHVLEALMDDLTVFM
jgi:hypothetical protein